MRSKLFLYALAFAFVPAASNAQAAHPDYSGAFTLDPAQSEQSPLVPPKLIYHIKLAGTGMVVERTQASPAGDMQTTLRYTLDGNASVNEYPVGGNVAKVSTVVTWDHESLVLSSVVPIGDNRIEQVDKWTLLDGGKKLQIERSVNNGQQTMTGKMLLVRQ
ncbi:MAG: hypothetical protein ABIY52_06210 [Gemmatimonadaceae bacterium]